jgi:hypothetical protein
MRMCAPVSRITLRMCTPCKHFIHHNHCNLNQAANLGAYERADHVVRHPHVHDFGHGLLNVVAAHSADRVKRVVLAGENLTEGAGERIGARQQSRCEHVRRDGAREHAVRLQSNLGLGLRSTQGNPYSSQPLNQSTILD